MSNMTEDARATRALSDDEIRYTVPSVFATEAKAGASGSYTFLPTSSILDGMRAEGWVPVQAQEQRVVGITNRGYQKHMLRFARMSDLEKFRAQLEPGKHQLHHGKPIATRMDVMVVNSHDRTSGYQIYGSPYKLVCHNGLVVSDEAMQHVSIRHVGFSPEKVVQATVGMASEMPLVMEMIAGFADRVLTDTERVELAERALGIRWDDPKQAPIGPGVLLEPRRHEDYGSDLWTVWNVVQENLIKGGRRDNERTRAAHNEGRRAPGKVRGVVAIDENLRINRELWELAEEFGQA